MISDSEKYLVGLLRDGKDEGFERLIEEYQGRIYSICYRMMNDEIDAQDLVQETFIKVYQKIDKFKFESSFKTWVYRIAINICKNRLVHLKAKTPICSCSIEDMEGDNWESNILNSNILIKSNGFNEPIENLERQEQRDQIAKVLSCLDDDLKSILILRELDEHTYSEIAEIQGIPNGTVKSRLHKARLMFACLYKQEQEKQDTLGTLGIELEK